MNTQKEYYAEDLGYCDICDTHTPQDECGRCGEEVCVYCHASIGCDV
jgi:hypothetical protein